MKLSIRLLPLITWFTALVLTVPTAALADDTEGPKQGTLLIAGGGGKHAAAIFRKFVELAGGNDARIVIVPTAISSDPKYDYQNMGTVRFARDTLKLKHVTVLHTHDRLEADTREFVQPLKTADGVWFSGGRQWRFADSYLGTRSERNFTAS